MGFNINGFNNSGVSNEGLVLELPFDSSNYVNSSLTLDSSSQQNDGIVNGSTFNSSGGIDSSGDYSFDGVNDYVSVARDSSIEPDYISISMWIKPRTWANNDGILAKDHTSYASPYYSYNIQCIPTGRKARINLRNSTGTYTNMDLAGIQLNKWNHIVFTYDGNKIKGYRDGILNIEKDWVSGPLGYSATDLIIGKLRNFGQPFNGSIDEVRIFNYSLTPTQIKKLYRTRAGFYLDNNQILQANTQFLGMPGIFNDSTNLAPGITPKTNITTFNGVTNYLTMPAMELSLADGVVLSWWSKLNANDSITTTDVVFGNDSTTNSYIHFWVNGPTNVLCMEGDVDGDTDCWTLLRAPSVSLSHYVITCEGYVCKAYQDAQELSLWLYDGVLSSNLTIKYLGKAGDSNYMFNGSISNILIFDDFWNQSTVQSYYDGSNSPASRGFVWNINSSIPLGTQAWQDYWLTCNDSLGTSYSENYSYYLDSVEIGVNTYFNPNLIHSVQNDKQTFTLELLNISWVVPTANLTYNGTVYESPSVSTTNNIDYNLSFNIDIGHDLNISVKNHTRKFWFNYSVPPFRNSTTVLEQNVYNMLIDNCSNYTTRAISFFLRNKTSEALMIGTIDGYFELTYHNSSETRNYNLSWDNGSGTYGLCMWPPFLLANITAQLEYVNGSTSHNYYFGNTQISNTSFDTDLYFVGGTTQVVFYVIDENDDEVVDAFIKVRMYDVSTNTHTTVEILKTDSDGMAIGNIVLNTQQYSFVIEYLGQTVYTTNPTIITLSPKTFRISLGSDYFDTHEVVRGVSGSVVFDNDTKLFTFDFNDPSGRSVEACLEITKISPYGEIIINSSCVGSSSGTINLLVGGSSFVDSYLGTGTVQIEGITYLLDQASADFNYDYKTWGKEGLFGAFLLTTTLGMLGVGMLNPAVSIVLMVVAVVGAFLMKIINFGATGIFTIVLLGGIALYFVTRREN